jgi:type III secretion protein U
MGEKQFEPSAKKMREALVDGKSKRSQLFASSVLSLIVVYSLQQILQKNWVSFDLLIECLWSQELSSFGKCGASVLSGLVWYFAFSSAMLLLATLLLQWGQVGTHWLPSAVAPNAKKISFEAGFGRIGSGLKSLPVLVIKIILVLLLIAPLVAQIVLHIIQSGDLYIYQHAGVFISQLNWFLLCITSIFICFGIYDLFSQRRKFKEQVYLDHEQMKREFKESEGDPHVKSHRRALHQAISREDMVRQIKKARVIVVERIDEKEENNKGSA